MAKYLSLAALARELNVAPTIVDVGQTPATLLARYIRERTEWWDWAPVCGAEQVPTKGSHKVPDALAVQLREDAAANGGLDLQGAAIDELVATIHAIADGELDPATLTVTDDVSTLGLVPGDDETMSRFVGPWIATDRDTDGTTRYSLLVRWAGVNPDDGSYYGETLGRMLINTGGGDVGLDIVKDVIPAQLAQRVQGLIDEAMHSEYPDNA